MLAIVVAAIAAPPTAGAFSGGISGASGKQNFDCSTFCHVGGVAPQVRFDAPPTVAAGATVQIRFTVVSGDRETQSQAGFNVAASGGSLDVLAPAGGVWKLGDEISHDAPQPNDAAGAAFWDFTWTAPETPGAYVLFGAGNSVDGLGNPNGDLAATTILTLEVSDVRPPAPAPAASLPAMIALVATLVACGGLAIRRQRRPVG